MTKVMMTTELTVLDNPHWQQDNASVFGFISYLPDAAMIVDGQLRIVMGNKNLEQLLMQSKESLQGRELDTVLPHLSALAWQMKNQAAQPLQLVTQLARVDTEVTVQPLNDIPGHFALIILRDISDFKKQCDQLERLARTDDLTQLANRRHFMDLAQKEIERFKRYGGHLSLAMFDIDKFKQINDNYGHQAGDEVLKAIATNCRSVLRDLDIMARLGGDEFVLLMPQTNIKQARQSMERIRKRIAAETFKLDELSLKATVSIGVVEAFANVQTIDDVIRRADGALYAAKHAGRNQVKAGYYPVPQAC